MDTRNALLAIILSFLILFGYQYFFAEPIKPPATEETTTVDPVAESSAVDQTSGPQLTQQQIPAVTGSMVQPQTPAVPQRPAKKVSVETDLFTAVVSEAGGTIESFILKNYKQTNAADSAGMQLVSKGGADGAQLKFAWGNTIPDSTFYEMQSDEVSFSGDKASLSMSATTATGLVLTKTYTFNKNSYLFDVQITINNPTEQTLQGKPHLMQINKPFGGQNTFNRFLFNGPASLIGGQLEQYSPKKFAEGPNSADGVIDWIAYEGIYFMCGIIPEDKRPATFVMSGDDKLAHTQITGDLDTVVPGGNVQYNYKVYYGPKKISILKETGYNLEKAVDFGWFDVIARPTLMLLNFFYSYVHNYGIAIILVTIIFKAIFWPITQKGLKSMKNMQKLQPKMVKLKEKYKNDPQAMNREVMALYKSYKVNPLGGCLPMVLQIPVFFALYKVLLLGIELRHAPFMLWITDLSAPDRLWIGFDIPYLGGLPVLTLLMGASMFLQQKMTPTTADPTQAKIMMMLPVVFTFMFVNFASGLVLYWFVNNLLSILQQQLINRSVKA